MRKIIGLLGFLLCFGGGVWGWDANSQAGFYLVENGQIRPYADLIVLKPKPVVRLPIPDRRSAVGNEVLEPLIEEPIFQAPVIQFKNSIGGLTIRPTPEPVSGPISVIVPQRINSGHCRSGDVLKLKMENPIFDRSGRILVQKNAEVLATIKRARAGGLFSKRGVINVSLDYAKGNYGKKIPITGSLSYYGGGNRNLTLAGAILIAWPLFFLQGSNAVIEAGTAIPANIIRQTDPHENSCELVVEE